MLFFKLMSWVVTIVLRIPLQSIIICIKLVSSSGYKPFFIFIVLPSLIKFKVSSVFIEEVNCCDKPFPRWGSKIDDFSFEWLSFAVEDILNGSLLVCPCWSVLINESTLLLGRTTSISLKTSLTIFSYKSNNQFTSRVWLRKFLTSARSSFWSGSLETSISLSMFLLKMLKIFSKFLPIFSGSTLDHVYFAAQNLSF